MSQNKYDKTYTKNDLNLNHIDVIKTVKRKGRPPGKTNITIPCVDCDQVFYRRCDFRIHRTMAHQYNKFRCDVCNRQFCNKKRLTLHYRHHNVGGKYECFYCLKGFNKGWKMRIHMVNHTGKAPYLCHNCNEDFLYPGKLAEHKRREHFVFNTCRDCCESFDDEERLTDHLCKLYGCKDCRSWFVTTKELKSHLTIHETATDNLTVQEVTAKEKAAHEVTSKESTAKVEEPNTELASRLEPHIVPNSNNDLKKQLLRQEFISGDGTIGFQKNGTVSSPCQGELIYPLSHSSHRNLLRMNKLLQKLKPDIADKRADDMLPPKLPAKFYNEGKSSTKLVIRDVIDQNITSQNRKESSFGSTRKELPSLLPISDRPVENNKVQNDFSTEQISLNLLSNEVNIEANNRVRNENVIYNSSMSKKSKVGRDSKLLHNLREPDKVVKASNTQVALQGLISYGTWGANHKSLKSRNRSKDEESADSVMKKLKTDSSQRNKDSEQDVVFVSQVTGQNTRPKIDNIEFKKPTQGLISSTRYINILKRKPEIKNNDKEINKQDVSEWEVPSSQICTDSHNQSSLISWLTSDSNPQCLNDFVFDQRKNKPVAVSNYSYKSCKIKWKKNDYDMSFEDLCQF